MQNFFDLTERDELLIPMYGTVHMISLSVMVLLIVLIFLFKDKVRELVNNRRFMLWFIIIFLAEEALYWSLIWGYQVEPMYERFPLHLCGSLSLLMPILILTEKYNWFRFFGYWSICAGFISMVNPSYGHDEIWSYAFITYHIRHLFLLLMPMVIQIGRGFKHSYREFLYSSAVLAGWAVVIFLLDWATGANYMHLGQNNMTPIPFLPKSFTEWPWSLPSFSGTGIILTHIGFLCFLLMARKKKVQIP